MIPTDQEYTDTEILSIYVFLWCLYFLLARQGSYRNRSHQHMLRTQKLSFFVETQSFLKFIVPWCNRPNGITLLAKLFYLALSAQKLKRPFVLCGARNYKWFTHLTNSEQSALPNAGFVGMYLVVHYFAKFSDLLINYLLRIMVHVIIRFSSSILRIIYHIRHQNFISL